MDDRERARQLVEEAEKQTAKDLRAALAKLREAINVDPNYPDLEDEIFLREDAIAKLDGVLEYIVVLLREGKEYHACQMLKDLPDNYIIQDKSGLVRGLTENIAKVEKLIAQAKDLPAAKNKKAIEILEQAVKLLPDYPGLKEQIDSLADSSQKAGAYVVDIAQALQEGNISEARKLLGEFRAAHHDNANLGKCEAAIRNKDRELDQKRVVRKVFVKRVAVLLLLLAGVVGYSFYEFKMIGVAGQKWAEVNRLLDQKKFTETQKGCREVIARLGKVRVLFQGRRQDLLNKAEQVLASEVVIRGAEGKVQFDGGYIPQKYLANAEVIKMIVTEAERLAQTGGFSSAIQKYEMALAETGKIERELGEKIAAGINLSIKECYIGVIKDLLSKASALYTTGSIDASLSRVDLALDEANKHGITGQDQVFAEIVGLREKIVLGKLNQMAASGDKLYALANYDVAIQAYENALAFAQEERVGGRSFAERLNELIVKCRVGSLLVEGDGYYAAAKWPESVKSYRNGLALAAKLAITNMPAISKAENSLRKATRMALLSEIDRLTKQGQQQLRASEWQLAKAAFQGALDVANKGGVDWDREITAAIAKARAGFDEAEERNFIKDKKEYLEAKYAPILRRAFDLSGGAALLNPEIILLSNDDDELKFSVAALSYSKKGAQGKYSRYEVTYRFDRNRGTWNMVAKTSDSKVATDKRYN